MPIHWYAIQSKPNKEDALFEQLTNQNIEAFYPRIAVRPVNPRSKKVRAYFPGYLFVHVDMAAVGLSTLNWMPFARGMVVFDEEPATVPDDLVEAIRHRLESANKVTEPPEASQMNKGDRVVIEEGPFAGYEAIFDVRLAGSERVRVLIKLLSQRQVPLELRAGQIRPPQNPQK